MQNHIRYTLSEGLGKIGSTKFWAYGAVVVNILCWNPSLGQAADTANNLSQIEHQGGGVFLVNDANSPEMSPVRIDLKNISHGYDPEIDPDVPPQMDVTLDDGAPRRLDGQGRPYAILTLYQVDPPLADVPSKEFGIDRGIDMRSPSDVVKSAYSNYVSTVVTDDPHRLPVPSHPIGHFFVKIEVPSYPTVLTGMTTIARADEELVELTLGRRLGLGGVLLTPQPGRLNSADEVREELELRQRRLKVTDGLNYRSKNGRPAGPIYIIEDGNVVFARFLLPISNAEDALRAFVRFIATGQHRTFGALQSRPYKGTGAGCSAFAVSWLKASGVILFVEEPQIDPSLSEVNADEDWRDFWKGMYQRIDFPWPFVGCDERTGAARPVEADYTVYDSLLHGESRMAISNAVPGLAEKIRADQGVVVSTIFAFGALTPIRDLVLASKRKDPNDEGDYEWSEDPDDSLTIWYWNNKMFSNWVKRLWKAERLPEYVTLVKEGRFRGVEIEAMEIPRQAWSFNFGRKQPERGANRGASSCREVFDYLNIDPPSLRK